MNPFKYHSAESNIENIADQIPSRAFNIPLYQRLYVWQEEQVETLVEDLLSAFTHNTKEDYYLGNVICVETRNGKWDLVDGQQRFTSLWLLLKSLSDLDEKNHYSITLEEREISLEQIIDLCCCDSKNELLIKQSDVSKLMTAYTIFKDKLDNYDKRAEFLKFVKRHVKLVITKAPQMTNLNKLFEVINGRGMQLKQHELLKAKLLNFIDKKKQASYAKVWDACADMSSLFEKSIKQSTNATWAEHRLNISFEQFLILVNSTDSNSKSDETSLFSIVKNITEESIGDEYQSERTVKDDDTDATDENRYRSIISFEYFLLYTLVIYKKELFDSVPKKDLLTEKSIAFKDKNLIAIFEQKLSIDKHKQLNPNEKELLSAVIEGFFKALYENRQIFDSYVIKSVDKVNTKHRDSRHEIVSLSINKDNKTAEIKTKDGREYRALALLQSMLYHAHTRQTQEWLIPFLTFVKMTSVPSSESLLTRLIAIDNHLYSCIDNSGNSTQDETVLVSAKNLIDKPLFDFKMPCHKNIETYLRHKPKNGTEFKHYWFYKIDWIIYYQLAMKNAEILDSRGNSYLTHFYFSARNSVEHISPQHEDENDPDSINRNKPEMLHLFANLALLSRSHNSSASNGTFRMKKAWFEDSRIHNLKLAHAFNQSTWSTPLKQEDISDEKDNSGILQHSAFYESLVKEYFTKS